ncbi:MAG: iron ABC transporter permease [Gammaproteobacteria bacterium]|nr:iron ABC transporter permease [Gammaproteobacteria bacterium]
MSERSTWLIAVLVMGSLLLGLVAVSLGSTPLELSRVIAALLGGGPVNDQIVVLEIRLPRALAAFVTGAALGISGAALQGLLRNPLAEPGVLGVSACASLGATLALFFGLLGVSSWALPASAVLGALAATALLAFMARRVGSMVTLILIGVGLSSFAGALMALLMNLSPNPFTLADMVNWMLGTVSNRSLADLGFALPFLIPGIGLLLWVRDDLSVLTLGEETAAGTGLDLSRLRWMVIVGAGLATGAAVSLAGAIGFVGIVAPHLVRPWVNHRPGAVLVPAALVSGIILLAADLLVRTLPTTTELKLGVVAALIGAPAFVWIASRRGVRHD